MIESILALYAVTILAFYIFILKDVNRYSFKIFAGVLIVSLVWPIALIIYYLDDKIN